MKRLVSIIFFLLAIVSKGHAQSAPPLERTLSIVLQGVQIDVALSRISQQGKFTFSYNPAILNSNQVVSIEYTNKTVREILNNLLGESITAKGKGNYIILTKTATPTKKEIVNNTVSISGYVLDADTGEKIAEVSVYEKKSLTAVITDEFGFFKITLNNPNEEAVLSFSKRSFIDTLVVISPGSNQFFNMAMRPEPKVIVSVPIIDTIRIVAAQPPPDDVVSDPPIAQRMTLRDFLNEKVFSKNIFSRKKGAVNVSNIKEPLYREFQLSFVPFVGTNHKLSGNVVNGYSLNVLGGYSLGTRNLEFGGLFNIDRGDVSYGQFAGLFNVVGGETNGVQMAGLGNVTRRKVNAFQFAGLFNANIDSAYGGQFAGLFNVNGRASQGGQFAGLFNVQPANYNGSQIAGLFNVATHQLNGSQTAGILNFAHNVNGAQLGLINYADSVRGVPIGLVSFVSRGYHKLEFSADEIFYINAAFRTGVRQFYNILQAGLKPESLGGPTDPTVPISDQQNVWSFGYGIGTAPRIAKKLFLNFDLTANHINKGSFTNSVSLLSKAFVGVDFQVARRFSIAAGATFNAYLSDPAFAGNPEVFTDFKPSIVNTHTFSNGNEMKMWWGGKIGVRFF